MEEFLENGIKNSFSIKRGNFLACWGTISVSGHALFLRVHHVSGHLNFGKMSFSKAYVKLRGHGKEIQRVQTAKRLVLLGSFEQRSSTALPSVNHPSIFCSESPDFIRSHKPRQVPDTCLLFTTFWRQNYLEIKRLDICRRKYQHTLLLCGL